VESVYWPFSLRCDPSWGKGTDRIHSPFSLGWIQRLLLHRLSRSTRLRKVHLSSRRSSILHPDATSYPEGLSAAAHENPPPNRRKPLSRETGCYMKSLFHMEFEVVPFKWTGERFRT